MLIIVYGEDTYSSRAYRQELIKHFKEKFDPQGYNFSSFGGNYDVSEIGSAISSFPFLSEKRMVVVDSFFEKFSKKEESGSVFEKIPESTICVLWEESGEKDLQKKKVFTKLLRQKDTKKYLFPLLSGLQLEKWARDRARKLNIEFESGALEELVLRVGSDLWQLGVELEKCAARGEKITKEIIRKEVKGATPENIFNFVDAVAMKNPSAVMRELRVERSHDIPVTKLLVMILWHFTMVREAHGYIKETGRSDAAELAKVFGWHPFVARKISGHAKKFTLEELATITDALFETELALKTGRLDPDSACDLLVGKLLEKNI